MGRHSSNTIWGKLLSHLLIPLQPLVLQIYHPFTTPNFMSAAQVERVVSLPGELSLRGDECMSVVSRRIVGSETERTWRDGRSQRLQKRKRGNYVVISLLEKGITMDHRPTGGSAGASPKLTCLKVPILRQLLKKILLSIQG